MDFLLYIFNLSWSSYSFLSIWKTSSIIPVHKMGKPLDSSDSFRPISLTSCVSELFELNLFFPIGALAWFIKITKVVPFESVEVFRKNPFLALYFSPYSSMIFRPLCLLPSAALFTLTIWPFGPPPLGPHCDEGYTWSSVSIGALV